ncbi:MAG: HEAT repeat domain-containing protein [Methanobacterium sp.]|nr:HEAT repeat domain-containing protein [Methanobacterium sp.]
MGFYDLSKKKREELVNKIEDEISLDLKNKEITHINKYSSDPDTYIRKSAYLVLGRTYHGEKEYQDSILSILDKMLSSEDDKIRQTAIYAYGEIGKKDASMIDGPFQKAMEDKSSTVRNAVVGALKQMGQKNPQPTLDFAKKYLDHPNPEIRREMVHGIELRGRTHPEDVLPILAELQDEEDKKVRKMIIHVLGQISYKKGCLEKVLAELGQWENHDMVQEALREIIDVHKRYKFAAKSHEEALKYIEENIK